MKRILLLVPALIALTLATACTPQPKTQAKAPEVVRDVQLTQVAAEQLPESVKALGTVQAFESAQLASQMMGTVTGVHVREGDQVRRGQLLVEIDPAQSQAGLDRARAALAAAQHEIAAAITERDLTAATLKRYTTLYERKSVSPQEFDEVKARNSGAAARVESAQAAEAQARAAVAQAQAGFNFTRIRAPFDGIVTGRRVDPGAMAAPGVPLLSVESTSKYRVEVTVDESSLRYVKMGGDVLVSLDGYADRDLRGRVAQIVPAADAASRSFLIKVDLPRQDLMCSGLSATAYFPRGSREAVVVPRTAVMDRGAMKAVYVLDENDVATLRYISVGNPAGDRLEVLSGLTPRERVVSAPGEQELAGKRIEVR